MSEDDYGWPGHTAPTPWRPREAQKKTVTIRVIRVADGHEQPAILHVWPVEARSTVVLPDPRVWGKGLYKVMEDDRLIYTILVTGKRRKKPSVYTHHVSEIVVNPLISRQW